MTKQEAVLQNIQTFVSDLEEFSEDRPLKLFNLLVSQFEDATHKHFKQVTDSFNNFYNKHRSALRDGKLGDEDENSKIEFNDKIYISLIKIYRDSSKDEKKTIEQNLLTIGLTLNPGDREMLGVLEDLEKSLRNLKVDTSTPAGELIGNFMTETIKAMKDVDPNNPVDVVGSVLKTGGFEKMATQLQKGMTSGDITFPGVMKTMQGMLGSLASAIPEMSGEPATEAPENANTANETVPEPVKADLEAFNIEANMSGLMGAMGTQVMSGALGSMMGGGGTEEAGDDDGNSGMVENLIGSAMDAASASLSSSN